MFRLLFRSIYFYVSTLFDPWTLTLFARTSISTLHLHGFDFIFLNSLQFQLRFINFLFLFLFFRFMIFVWFFKTCHFEKYQHAFWWTLSIKTINLLNQLKKLVVPGAPPRNITADATSPTTIAVSWLPPPSDRANGRIVYYKGI